MDKSDFKKLAKQFMVNAVDVKVGDNIWIEYLGEVGKSVADACAKQVKALGAQPVLVNASAVVINDTIGQMSVDEIQAHGQEKLARMKEMQGYIRIKDDANQSGVVLTAEQAKAYKKALRPMTDYRVNNTRWLVTAAPTESFAKACGMSLSKFEDFYRDVCLVDYSKMTQAVEPLQKIMAKGKTVRIYSPAQETDLSFSIYGIDAVPCTGVRNIPDGECYTAPVKDSINGTIKYGPSEYDGQSFKFIKLAFKDGRIVSATAENEERTAKLNEMLDTDDGARYIGEFAINFNPYIQHPTGSILFDEKIDGGIHLAAGQCYDATPNGNKSAVHWDMVHIQRLDYGGGDLYIDDLLIRKNGIFVIPELQALNPEALKAATASSKAPRPAFVPRNEIV